MTAADAAKLTDAKTNDDYSFKIDDANAAETDVMTSNVMRLPGEGDQIE